MILPREIFMDLIVNNINLIIWAAVVTALVYGFWLIVEILKKDSGDEKMREIASAIQVGAGAYLKRQYQVVAIVALVLSALIYYALGQNKNKFATVPAHNCFIGRLCHIRVFRVCQFEPDQGQWPDVCPDHPEQRPDRRCAAATRVHY